jgi:hypothetical protein
MDEEMIVPQTMYYLTDYGLNVMTFARANGIAYEKYVNRTGVQGTEWGTWRDSNIITNVETGQVALEMDNLAGLPEFFIDKVVEGTSSVDENGNRWYTPIE